MTARFAKRRFRKSASNRTRHSGRIGSTCRMTLNEGAANYVFLEFAKSWFAMARNLIKQALFIVSIEAFSALCRAAYDRSLVDETARDVGAAFAASETPRAGQAPTEKFEERERACSDQARKIGVLRRGRLAAVGETTPAPFVFQVVRYRGHWRTLHCNKHSSPFPDEAAAIAAAKKLAIAKRKQGHDVKVTLRRTDGNDVFQAIDD
jgi:hypothetical protein